MSLQLEAIIQSKTNKEIAALAQAAKVQRHKAVETFCNSDPSLLDPNYSHHPLRRATRWSMLEHTLNDVLFSRMTKEVKK